MKHAMTLFALLAILPVGCQQGADSTEPQSKADEPAAKPGPAVVAPVDPPAAERLEKAAAMSDAPADEPAAERLEKAAQGEGCGEGKEGGCGAQQEEGCGAASASEPVVGDVVKTGEGAMHGGAVLAGAPVVTVAQLMDAPDEWVGKTVTVKGDVSAMCHHKRGWFAIAAGDQSGRQVRVMTAPNFLVPRDAVSATVTAEGVVEVIELSPRMARHLSKDYGVGKESAEPVKRVVIRATGADFAGLAAE